MPAVPTDTASNQVARKGGAGSCAAIAQGDTAKTSTARSPRCMREIPLKSFENLSVAFLCAFGVDAEHPCAAPDAAFQIGEQPFVGKVERVRMLPVVSSDFVEPTNHLVVAYFDRQLAPVVEAAGGEVDRADNRGDPVR